MSSTTLQKRLIPAAAVLVIIAITYTFFSSENTEPESSTPVLISSAVSAQETQVQLSSTASSATETEQQPVSTQIKQPRAENTEKTTTTDAEVAKDVVTESTTVESIAPLSVPVPTFVEGTDYITKFPNEQAKKPVLVEFFSYMCPHCFNFEPTVLRWKKQKPESVALLKVPVTFGRGPWRMAAKSYYIAEELQMTEAFSSAMFKKIHIDKKPPVKESDLAQIFASLGVDNKAFTKAANSFNVDSKLRKADFLAKKYKVKGVPYFLINFKYEIGKTSYESEASLFQLWNNLPGRDF